MIRTFLDSGVLLAAVRSVEKDQERALQLLEDPDRHFLTSAFVQLELVPKASFHKKRLEKSFYDEYFRAAEWCQDVTRIVALAQKEAAQIGLSAMDALHLAAAHLLEADEFITTERPGKPLYRSKLAKVLYLFE